MIFLVDEQLPWRLARKLIDAGHQATHVLDMLAPAAKDHDVARLANTLGAILMSKDEDFVVLSGKGILLVPLLWIRLGNMGTSQLWEVLRPLLPTIEVSFSNGEPIVEIR